MRCYSDREIKRILSREPITMLEENQAPPAWRPIIAASFDPTQFIADLEFEMKFQMLMQSISDRMLHI